MREGFTQQRCPKCGGNIYLARDPYDGWYEKCLQCSRIWYLESVVEVREKVSQGSSGGLRQARSASKSKYEAV